MRITGPTGLTAERWYAPNSSTTRSVAWTRSSPDKSTPQRSSCASWRSSSASPTRPRSWASVRARSREAPTRGPPSAGVLELVLRALADHPDSLQDLDRLVQRLRATETGRAVLPDGFDDLWPSVMSALERRKEALA